MTVPSKPCRLFGNRPIGTFRAEWLHYPVRATPKHHLLRQARGSISPARLNHGVLSGGDGGESNSPSKRLRLPFKTEKCISPAGADQAPIDFNVYRLTAFIRRTSSRHKIKRSSVPVVPNPGAMPSAVTNPGCVAASLTYRHGFGRPWQDPRGVPERNPWLSSTPTELRAGRLRVEQELTGQRTILDEARARR